MNKNNAFKKKEKVKMVEKEKEINTYGKFAMCQIFYIYYSMDLTKTAFLQMMELRLREVKKSIQGHRANMINGLYK